MRYAIKDLSCRDTIEVNGWAVAELWVGDLTDERGNLYRDGAHKVLVTATGRELKVPFKTRTFKGEAAWMDAQRLYYDIVFWAQRQEGR